jgi:hypothetical protein
MRYRGFWIVGTCSSLWRKRWASISAFTSLRSSLRLPLRAHLGLAPKELFQLSTPWTSVGVASLSLSLAKGRTIKDAPPTPQSQSNSTTSNAASKPTKTSKPHQKKHPQKQTHTISRMRMAKYSIHIDRIDKFAILQYANLI